jgi:MHS family proline/betaine transporter-like MFS transporter
MTNSATAAPKGGATRRTIVSAVFGNFMEYIDFGSYGVLAAIIGAEFFGGSAPGVQLLASLAVFGVSFLFRPLGGALFGYIGDRHGRKTALSWSVILMAVSTFAIGLLPSSAAIGFVAPLLLVILRAAQGVSIGGEYSIAAAYIVESAPKNRRALWASNMSWTSAAGTLVGTGLVLILTTTLSAEAMGSWGWRIPFLIALPLGVIGLWMRLKLEDTDVFESMKAAKKGQLDNPYKKLGVTGAKGIILCIAFGGGTGLGYYYFATYLNTYMSSTLSFSRAEALTISLVSLAIYGGLTPFVGLLVDRIGRKKLYVTGFFLFVIYGIPVFFLLGLGFAPAFAAVILFGAIESILNVILGVQMTEVFPANIRSTGASLGYNIGIALISGTGPFVAALLVSVTGNPLSPGFYLVAVMLIVGVIVALFLPETKDVDLHYEAVERAEQAVGSSV